MCREGSFHFSRGWRESRREAHKSVFRDTKTNFFLSFTVTSLPVSPSSSRNNGATAGSETPGSDLFTFDITFQGDVEQTDWLGAQAAGINGSKASVGRVIAGDVSS